MSSSVHVWKQLYWPRGRMFMQTSLKLFTDFFCFILWRPPEVGNGAGSAEELYADNDCDYYTNQGISQWLNLSPVWICCGVMETTTLCVQIITVFIQCEVSALSWWTDRYAVSEKTTTQLLCVHSVNKFFCLTDLLSITQDDTFY